MTFSQAWMKIKNAKLAKSKLLDIKVEKERAPTMKSELELRGQSQVLSFQDHEVREPFKSAKVEVTSVKKPSRARFYRAKATQEYPWNETPIKITHIHALHTYVIPRKTKAKELVLHCPALRPKATIPSKAKVVGARVASSKASPKSA